MAEHIKQIAAIIKAGDVKRYHAVYTVQEQTVAAHSWRVALLVRVLLGDVCSGRAVFAALFHDFGEFATGDMPANVKQMLGVSAEMQRMEQQVLDNLGLFDPNGTPLTERETLALRIADCIDGVLFCNREIALGNLAMLDIKERYLLYIDSYRNSMPSDWVHIINQLRHGNPV